jgi:L-arabinose isomerase
MKTQNPKIGLLPLYLELYDITSPKIKSEFEPFIDSVCSQFKLKGVDVVLSDVCRISKEFGGAVRNFERTSVDCIVTLHLAYSPSLECIETLTKTKLPVIVLDTTPDECYNSMSLLMFNHGIHGVQDMCNMLKRYGKSYIIEAGHIKTSDVIDRVVCHVKGAQIAHIIRNSRVGRVGEAFAGMGDFAVETSVLSKNIGITICPATPEQVAGYLPDINDPEVSSEIKEDEKRFDLSRVSMNSHKISVQTGLALRKWIEKEKLTAFSVNFQSITKAGKLPVMPFLEISKAMSRGTGYAGEGDVLTASLVGAMAQVLGTVSFTEMFCPDWKNNVIFLSHMGEINIDVAEEKPALIEMAWSFTDAQPPVFPSACFKQGEALLVNLAPGPDDTFSLILSPVEMVNEADQKNFGDGIRGWMKPKITVPDFLEAYSEAGGTHHSALVYGDPIEELKSFGKIMNWNVIVIN